MILNCDICGRPDHNSEVHPESRCWREQGTQSGRLDCFERGYVRLKAEVAAAEERGRRRGVEERDMLLRDTREGLWKARIRIGILMDRMRGCDDEIKQRRRDEDGHKLSVELEGPSWLAEHDAQIARIDAALAPRDSGKDDAAFPEADALLAKDRK